MKGCIMKYVINRLEYSKVIIVLVKRDFVFVVFF